MELALAAGLIRSPAAWSGGLETNWVLRWLDHHQRSLVGRRITAAYRAKPQSESEVDGEDSATIDLIADSPGLRDVTVIARLSA
jgi:hypothetical protein